MRQSKDFSTSVREQSRRLCHAARREQEPKVCGLSAGERWIRNFGSAREEVALFPLIPWRRHPRWRISGFGRDRNVILVHPEKMAGASFTAIGRKD